MTILEPRAEYVRTLALRPRDDLYVLLSVTRDGRTCFVTTEDDDDAFAVTDSGMTARSLSDMERHRSASIWVDQPATHPLDYGAPNLIGGDRLAERVDQVAHALTIPEKMACVEKLGLSVLPPQVIGITWSKVISETAVGAGWSVVCRRLHMAVADAAHPAHYHNHLVELAHFYHPQVARDWRARWMDFPELQRPMDAVFVNSRLFVLDNGRLTIDVWRIAGIV